MNTSVAFSDYWLHFRASSGLNATNTAIAYKLTILEGINYPPKFEDDLKKLSVDLNSANPYLKYALPEIVDYNFEQFSITVSDIPRFGNFDAEFNTFTFKSMKEEDIGYYEIMILLVDERLLKA